MDSTDPGLLARALELAPRVGAGLCDACLGRSFAKMVEGASNAQRGRLLRGRTGLATPSLCSLCEGLVERVDAWTRLCLAAANEYEYASFVVGTVTFKEIRERERRIYDTLAEADPALAARFPAKANPPPWTAGEWLKSQLNRDVGRAIEAATGKRVDFERPDLTFRVDTRFDHASVQSADLFVMGRYRKLARDLPQTRWPCRACQGLGCRQCNGRGKTYDDSVEELVAAPLVAAARAEGEAFHGMGREDIDARALGRGRPFILELKRPRLRTLDLARLEGDVNRTAGPRVEVLELRPAVAGDAARFKAAEADKSYHAVCRAAEPIEQGRIEAVLRGLEGVALDQRTPQRVSHRRADLVRQRSIQRLTLLTSEGARFTLEIRADSGTYIKEFVSGDEGRTTPSLTERLGVPCKVEELDVVAVHWEPEPSIGVARANA